MHTFKRLVYHLFLYDGCFESNVYKLHLACLSYFAKIFDQAIFVLAMNDTDNQELIKQAEKAILNKIHIPDIKFIVDKNYDYREAATFYSQIANRLDELDGITFFGHIKGAGNEFNPNIDMLQIYNWVIAAYFFNLFYMDEVTWYLITSPSFNTYGALKCKWENIENVYDWIYSGTFFWINGQRTAAFLRKNDIKLPPLNNRYCAETFCGNIFKFNNAEAGSHKCFHYIADPGTEFLNWYKYATEFIEEFLDDDSRQDFYNFRDEMLKAIEL